MLKVGLTGGIGSGKSTVGKILEAMGYPVFYSDDAAKKCVDTHPEIRRELTALLGEDTYENNQLNRTYVALRMFSDDQIRLKMNAIIHPRVRVLFDEFIQQHPSTLVFNEAAILIETGAYKLFDQLVLVSAPDELKIKRVMEREQCSRESVIDRMEKQWTDAAKKDVADFVLINDEESLLIPQIEALIEVLNAIH